MKVSILVPVDDLPDTPTQEFALSTWAEFLPDAEIVRGCNLDVPYSRAKALNEAADKATGGILVITDRDLVYPDIRKTLRRVSSGSGVWAMSQNTIRLGPIPTRKAIHGASFDRDLLRGIGNDRYRAKGGIIVLSREAWDIVGGMDTRYRGWGSEDTAFTRALRTLVGASLRFGDQWHLWHPATQLAGTRSKLWTGQTEEHIAAREALNVRYRDAMTDPDEMRRLIAEAE